MQGHHNHNLFDLRVLDYSSNMVLHSLGPFLTRTFSKNYLGWRAKTIFGKKPVSYEEMFPKKSLAKKSLRKKKLKYSQPRNFLTQKNPGDNRNCLEEFLGSLCNITHITTYNMRRTFPVLDDASS